MGKQKKIKRDVPNEAMRQEKRGNFFLPPPFHSIQALSGVDDTHIGGERVQYSLLSPPIHKLLSAVEVLFIDTSTDTFTDTLRNNNQISGHP